MSPRSELSAKVSNTSESVTILLPASLPRQLFKKAYKKRQDDVVSQIALVSEAIISLDFFFHHFILQFKVCFFNRNYLHTQEDVNTLHVSV